MPEHGALTFEIEDIALTDHDLFSLYLKYPEMHQSDGEIQDALDAEHPFAILTTTSPQSSPQSTQLYSSPLAHRARYETPTSSPLGPPDIIPFPGLTIAANEQEVEDLTTQFDLTLKSADIPEYTAELLMEMKSNIVVMATFLFSVSGEISGDLENVLRVQSAANWLISSFRQAQTAVEDEIDAVESILQLAPFTVRPAVEDLWANYKQMAELIIE
jgi:hypothetical protein